MEMMTLTKEQRELKKPDGPCAAQAAGAVCRELTPAQRPRVMFAQQQVLKAQAAKKAKDQRQAVRERMWDEGFAVVRKPTAAAEPRGG